MTSRLQHVIHSLIQMMLPAYPNWEIMIVLWNGNVGAAGNPHLAPSELVCSSQPSQQLHARGVFEKQLIVHTRASCATVPTPQGAS